ncbi:hypothetical protein CAEBREN_17808 [Caenorhabditis brenneri]|uniref:Uncharacterized protein n=1 Tax=Caenorhabditis brenneri TaxID=135651 RepID=G0NNU0_CAEBE|nr:hypothetical protein CAEBREN_17808 [Caenorhabditis brenneri]
MVSFFVQFVRICFSLCEGFNVSTIENKLVPTNSEETEYHLMNLAFKQYVQKVLEVEETREMLVDLVKNENVTSNEMKFLKNYPMLWDACMTKISQVGTDEWLARMNHLLTELREFRRVLEAERRVLDVTRFTEFDDNDTFDSQDFVLPIRSRQMRIDQITRGIGLDNRSEREEAMIERQQPKPSKKLKKKAPITFPKSSFKSYYNYSNPKKYNKSGRF